MNARSPPLPAPGVGAAGASPVTGAPGWPGTDAMGGVDGRGERATGGVDGAGAADEPGPGAVGFVDGRGELAVGGVDESGVRVAEGGCPASVPRPESAEP